MKLPYILPLFLAVMVPCGCETKATARAQARAAYAAGQASAYRRMLNETRTSIQIIGDVKNPEIEWEDGMTLAGLLLVAEYQGQNGPGEIIIERKGEKIPVDVKALLNGDDVALEPGDTVVINPETAHE